MKNVLTTFGYINSHPVVMHECRIIGGMVNSDGWGAIRAETATLTTTGNAGIGKGHHLGAI
jgi:hypothetical protein